ncbi:MAG: N-6 DNA methylase [Holdemanella biformis]|uniref:N-6 DNA methylase n=1 Tax=Holdemanella biformis TaxID=1735 RepID=UPI0024330E60|nr:N-6 DNA methylase [Holdemanella biformis]MBS6455950.1 N-6 DNA methylase [Holdemanella biformis]
MLNTVIETQMQQLASKSLDSSNKFGYDKSTKILYCYLLWAKKTSNNDLVKEVTKELSFEENFDLKTIEFGEEYTEDDCVSAVREIVDNNNGINEWMYSSPSSLNKLVTKIINLKDGESFCDFGSGDGKLLLNVFDAAHKNKFNCKYTGYEINAKQVLVSKCLMCMLNVDTTIINCDFMRDIHRGQFDKGYLYPPFGLKYSIDEWDSLKGIYGDLFTSRTESELLYLLKALENIKENGKLVTVFTTGAAFRSSGMLARKYLVENNFVEGIISLPARTLGFTAIPIDLWILKKDQKKSNVIKMLDASNNILDKGSKIAVELDVSTIIEEYNNNAKCVSIEDIKKNEYSLSINIYEVEKLTDSILNPVNIEDVCKIEKGSQYTISKFKDQISNTPTDYQLLTSINIQDGIVDYDSLPYVYPDPKLLKFKLEEGDIVVTTKSTVVKTFVANDLPDRNIIVTGGMIILKPDTSKVNPTYVKMFLDSSIGKSEFKSIIKGNTIGFVPFKEFKERMIISCPALEKQNKLSEQYNNMLWTINALTKQLADTKDELANIIENSLNEGE